jgi:hypothetical protein
MSRSRFTKRSYESRSYSTNQTVKRKREEEDEDSLIEKIKQRSSFIQKKLNSFSEKHVIERCSTNVELSFLKKEIENEFLVSIEENKLKMFQFICEDFPLLVQKLNLFQLKNVKNLEILKQLFDINLASKESMDEDKDLLIHFVSMDNIIVAEYLIKVQQFDLNFKSEKTGRTGESIHDLTLSSLFRSFKKR